MENKVGHKLLSPQKRAQLIKQLQSVIDELKAYGITLTTDDRKRVLRPRRGAEQQIQRVHDLAVRHGVKLKDYPLDGMADDLELAKQFEPFEDEFQRGLTLAEDTGNQAGSEAWEAFLAYYGVLSSMADRMPDLAAELKPVIEFMAVGRRKKVEAPPET